MTKFEALMSIPEINKAYHALRVGGGIMFYETGLNGRELALVAAAAYAEAHSLPLVVIAQRVQQEIQRGFLGEAQVMPRVLKMYTPQAILRLDDRFTIQRTRPGFQSYEIALPFQPPYVFCTHWDCFPKHSNSITWRRMNKIANYAATRFFSANMTALRNPFQSPHAPRGALRGFRPSENPIHILNMPLMDCDSEMAFRVRYTTHPLEKFVAAREGAIRQAREEAQMLARRYGGRGRP